MSNILGCVVWAMFRNGFWVDIQRNTGKLLKWLGKGDSRARNVPQMFFFARLKRNNSRTWCNVLFGV